jgi:hypothetical protein
MSNLDVTADVLDAFGLARNGDRPVRCFLRPCRPTEPHDAVLIGVHVNTSETLDVLGGELGLHFRGDDGILHEGRRVRAVRTRVFGGQGEDGYGKRGHDQYGRYDI